MNSNRITVTACLLFVFALFVSFTKKPLAAAAQELLSPLNQRDMDLTVASKIYLPIIYAPPPTGTAWTIITLDNTHTMSDMGDHSLRLTSAGRPRIAYGSSYLYYAHLEDTGWVIETVDGGASRVGKYTSLALDSNNLPYISYYDGTLLDLKYAHWNGSFWVIQTINSGTTTYGAGRFTSIAVGSDSLPYISYLGNDYNYSLAKYLYDLKYAHWTGSYWYMLTLDASDNIGGYTSIGLDPANHAHISYYDDENNKNIKYIQYTGSSWVPIGFDYPDDTGKFSSLAVDANSHVFISYFDESIDRLKMVTFYNDPLYTKVEIVDPSCSAGEYTSIALDSHGWPHIAYYDFSKKDLKYARWTGTAWMINTIDSSGDVGKYASLALDSHDLAHISYYDATHASLKYAVENYQVP